MTRQTNTSGSNSAVERDVIRQEASQVVKLWNKVDATAASADAKCVHVLIRAHEFKFFGRSLNLANLHKIATKAKVSEAFDQILKDLFDIAEPVAADRQRLVRLKLIVPAIIKEGGLDKIQISGKGALMVDASTELYKKTDPKTEVEGMIAIGIAKLDKGARQVLAKELPKAKTRTTKNKMAGFTNQVLFKEASDRIAKLNADDVKKNEQVRKQAQGLMVQLLGLLATDDDGATVNPDTVIELYTKAANG